MNGSSSRTLASPEALVGSSLGSYRLTRLLGAGGMGAVYEGVHPVIGARVAIKVLSQEVAGNPVAVERFFNEARAVNLIGHRNLVKILDLAVAADRYYCVMELLEGYPLSALLRGDPVPFGEAASILIQCADALQAAHDRGIVHRDVKPDNIFLVSEPGQERFVKIVDFGIAKLATPGVDVVRTAAGVVMGTPAYMSPEQAEGATDKLDGRSDVYSLGVVAFQMATGRLPFQEPTYVKVMMAHLATRPPMPRALAPKTPEAFERIILRCLAKEREARFQSMREVQEALEAAQDEVASRNPRPSAAPAPRAEPAPQRPDPARFVLAPPMGSDTLSTENTTPHLAAVAPVLAAPKAAAPVAPARPQSRSAELSAAAAAPGAPGPAPLPVLPPAIPILGSGLPDEPLPGAEMLEQRPEAPKPPPPAAVRLGPPPEEPLELDLPPELQAAPAAEPGPPPPPPGRRALVVTAGLLAAASVAGLIFLFTGAGGSGPRPAASRAAEAPSPAHDPPPPSSAPQEPAGPTADFAASGPLACPPGTGRAVSGPAVELQVITEPKGAAVRAQWDPSGCATGAGPWKVAVPKGAKVRLSYQVEGRAPKDGELVAAESQVVIESL